MTATTTDSSSTTPAPLTPEEIADRLIAEEPQISPDGRHVAFMVRPSGKKGEHVERAIWLSTDGAPARQFTGGAADDQSPRWSPDGARIAFVSDRKEREKYRVHVLRLDGGEALPLGELEGDFSAPNWSPDGRAIAILREDPETAEEKKKKEDRDDPIVVETEKKRRRLFIIDVESGKARQITYGTRQIWAHSWSRDGQHLAIVTTDGYDMNAACGAGDVWTVPASGGLPKHVARFPSLPNDALFVEGGLAVHVNQHWEDPVDSVWFVPDGGSPRNILTGDHGQVEYMIPIANDPNRVVVRMVEGTHAAVYAVAIADGTLTRLSAEGQYGEGSLTSGPSVSADGARVSAVWSDGDKPGEVFVHDAAAQPSAVTELGKSFAGRLSRAETVIWQSDDWEIEGILTYPRDYEEGKRYPLIVEIHGGPSWQWEDYCFLDWHDWAQLMASHGFAVLAPNPRGSTGRGTAFQRQLQNDVGGGEVRDLINGALAMVERGIADRERLGIGGWSWGGYLTATTITRTDIFKAAMMGAGLANLLSDHGTDDIPAANLYYFSQWPYDNFAPFWEGSAMKSIKQCTTPTLILHGESDARVHWTQGAEMFRALKTLGVPVEFVKYPREAHPIVERHHQIDLMRRLVAWYTKYLKPND